MHHPHYPNPQTPQNNLNAVKAPEQNVHLEQASSGLSDLSELSITSFDGIQATMNSEVVTSQLVVKAQEILDMQSRPIGILDNVTIDGTKVMGQMLKNAELCGGERALRYVASAICASDQANGLTTLANTWVKYFLWPFKANTSPPTMIDASEYATPTYDTTFASIITAPPNRAQRFAKEVLKRDNHRCVLTQVWHEGYDPDPDAITVALEASHILKRAVTVFSDSHQRTAPATWDIIRHYANLTENEVEDMSSLVDDPSNGIALHHDLHRNFDRFRWVFVKQDGTPNSYKCQPLARGSVGHFANNVVVFQDHSGEGIPLPSSKFLGLHAAIGRILHLSGAGDAIDLVMDRYSEGGPKVPSSAKLRGPDDWPLIVYHLRGLGIPVQ